jgi:hypothetical protein
MREFTKSMMSYTWAMSMFGVQQMVNLLTPQGGRENHPATDAFNNVSQCTTDEMGDAMRAAFRLGDNIQRGLVDMTFGVMSLGAANRGGRQDGRSGSTSGGGRQWGGGFTQQAANVGQQTAEAFRQGMGAMGQAAGAAGQAAGGAASGWGRGGDGPQAGPAQTGWGPMPSQPTGGGSSKG